MKNSSVLFLLFVGVHLVFFSCEKEEINSGDEVTTWLPGITAPPINFDNTTFINVVSQSPAWTNGPGSVTITGATKNSVGEFLDFEELTIGELQLTPNLEANNPEANVVGQFRYHFNQFSEDSDAYLKSTQLFAQESESLLELKSITHGDLRTFISFPQKLEVDLTANRSYLEDPFSISKSDGIRVKWNAPTDNARNDGMIGVAVVYDPGMSQVNDPSMPSSLPIFFEETEDDGEYFIPAEALADFPLNSTVNIAVARGEFQEYTVEITGNSVIVNGVTYEVSKGLILIP